MMDYLLIRRHLSNPPLHIIDFMVEWKQKYVPFYWTIERKLKEIYIARGLTRQNAQEKIWEKYSYFIDGCRDCFYGVVQLVKWDEDPNLFSFFLRKGTTCWLFNSRHGIDFLTPCELDDNLINSVFESDFFNPTQEPGANDIKADMEDFITSTLDNYKQLCTMADGYWYAKHFSNAYAILFKQIRVILRIVDI